MHGGEDSIWRSQSRHMWPVSDRATSEAVGTTSPPPPTALSSPSSDPAVVADYGSVSFLKDGRKIQVGDCALFQSGNTPPFIGIIRRFTSKEDCLNLCVNWLYRPGDVKLAKGILLEAAPNEVFYSFHKDVISAASLLHPCKVAFLRKGVELPSGVSSFVCRQVYDIANKCLWWLTDQDYIKERQEEVDQLLDKTRVEMHAAVQSGGRSPKTLHAPTSTQQINSGSDGAQNNGASFPPQPKGKKRERGDQVAEPIKRERPTKTDGDHSGYRLEAMKTDIAKITEKGALVTTEGVEKLVHLMQLGNEIKIELSGRVLLADVIADTDKIECLGRFVQLRGLPVLDDWLQEAHKGKTGDGSSPKESDKSTDELLLALLRALDKLPVNLTALQTCNIGKSVNTLRSHKNLEIQKKARSLVDTWKKRVDAEMAKNNDAKSVASNHAVSWPVKQGISETPQAESRHAGPEATSKRAITQSSACKMSAGKAGHEDVNMKATVTPGSVKSAIISKESPCMGTGSSGTSELPLAAVREEKSSSSSQSQNNSQSCSSDHAKVKGSSWKEDARSSTAGSINASKGSGGSSRHRRSNNGFLGSSNSGVHRGTHMGKSSSVNRTTTLDKLSTQSALSCERTLDEAGADHGNGHRLIVRIPNPGRSPARSATGGFLEDPSVSGSRASFPGAPDKLDHIDRKSKVGSDICRSHISTDVNAETWKNNDVKEGLLGSDEGDGSTAAVLDIQRGNADEAGRPGDVPSCSSSGKEKGGSLIEPKMRSSFSSMHALIESCAKYSEACAPLSSGDVIGMNLLASVAAGEMSKSGLVSPTLSPGSSPAKGDPCASKDEAKSRFSREDCMAQDHVHSDENAEINFAKHGKVAVSVPVSQQLQETSIHFSDDSKNNAPLSANELTTQPVVQYPNPSMNLYSEISTKSEVKCEEERMDKLDFSSISAEMKGLPVDGICQSAMDGKMSIDCTQEKIVAKVTKCSELVADVADGGVNGITASGRKSEKLTLEESIACAPSDEVPIRPALVDKQQSVGNHVEAVHRTGDAVASSINVKDTSNEIVDEPNNKRCNELEDSHLDPSDMGKKEISSKLASNIDNSQAASAVSPGTGNEVDGTLERKGVLEHKPVGSATLEEPSTIPAREAQICAKPVGSRFPGADRGRGEELAISTDATSFIITSKPDNMAKFSFDLNEGFHGDDINESEPVTSMTPVRASTVRLPGLAPFLSGFLSTGTPAPITVAAPAKGPFVPPENLLKNKGEAGWKGSAATSAFRPAEPRKVLEMPLNMASVQSSGTAIGKLGRAPLDIDLNVPDERVLEDMGSQNSPQTTGSESAVISNREAPTRCGGGLDLDLNQVDEGMENGQFLATTSNRLDVPLLPLRQFSEGFSNGEVNMFMDFDLNNGPGMDDPCMETLAKSQHARSSTSAPFLPPIAGLRMGNTDIGNVSSWFPPGNSYPAVGIPSFLHDRREQPYPIVAAAGAQKILGSVSGGANLSGDVYRGPVLQSSPAMGFSPASAFSYGGFPFGASFPLTSTSLSGSSAAYVDSAIGPGSCFPTVPSQLVGTAAGVSSHYPRPYVLSLPEGSTSAISESNWKWSRQGLDLNSGPGSSDVEVKMDRLASAPRQLPMSSSQAFMEEQARMFQMAGGGVKRKEREGGPWDERFYKQPSWQ